MIPNVSMIGHENGLEERAYWLQTLAEYWIEARSEILNYQWKCFYEVKSLDKDPKKFYKRDKQGYYYIPEIANGRKANNGWEKEYYS